MKKWVIALPVMAVSAFALWNWRSSIREWEYTLTKPQVPAAVAVQPRPQPSKPSLDLSQTTSSVAVNIPAPKPQVVTSPIEYKDPLPAEFNISIPFILQAPKQNWDMPFQEACEEASMLMVGAYYANRTKAFSADEAEKAILDLVAHEEGKGLKPDINATQVKAVLASYFGLNNVLLMRNPTAEQMKAAVANGYPIIVPAAGKLLKNPNFRNGGPPYHMFVIKGYTKDGKWITNDPGTRRGPDYVYSNAVIMDAMHDFVDGNPTAGDKVVLVVMPNTP